MGCHRDRVAARWYTDRSMARTLTKDEIFDLPIDERLYLIETLWDSIDPHELPLPESHRQSLDLALGKDYRRDPEEGRSRDEVRSELFPEAINIDRQRPGLGDHFGEELDAVLSKLEEQPLLYAAFAAAHRMRTRSTMLSNEAPHRPPARRRRAHRRRRRPPPPGDAVHRRLRRYGVKGEAGAAHPRATSRVDTLLTEHAAGTAARRRGA